MTVEYRGNAKKRPEYGFFVLIHGREKNQGVSPIIYIEEEEWTIFLMHSHLINMTALIVKDTKYKLNQARNIQDEHRHSIGYDLGTIAAGILERFLLMLKLYRKYSSIPDLKEKKYSIEEMMNILAVIQGAYNEIILEKSMFFQTLKAYEALDPDHVEKGRMDRLKSKKPSWFNRNRPKFRRAGLWKPGVDQFDI
ncbi:unnamed protein product [Pieris macdunnoughi]|uniref:Uncharacterized protein n=1 Tax=Pieris macdunnoughi TaxID=345717 RepID=A0A821XE89_9NEOP|nr:unnamed protein product [Pieris macdunnoughi]